MREPIHAINMFREDFEDIQSWFVAMCKQYFTSDYRACN